MTDKHDIDINATDNIGPDKSQIFTEKKQYRPRRYPKADNKTLNNTVVMPDFDSVNNTEVLPENSSGNKKYAVADISAPVLTKDIVSEQQEQNSQSSDDTNQIKENPLQIKENPLLIFDNKYSAKKSGRKHTKKSFEGARTKAAAGKLVKRILLVLVSVILFVVFSLYSMLFIVANGPSETAKCKAVQSAQASSALKWLPYLFMSRNEVERIKSRTDNRITDTTPINEAKSYEEVVIGDDGKQTVVDIWADAKDGMVLKTFSGETYKAYILLVKDPSRVSVGVSSDNFTSAKAGKTIFDISARHNAIAAINGGEFYDAGGQGSGAQPMGLTFSGGKCVWKVDSDHTFIGFDKDNKLIVREGMTYNEAMDIGIRDAVMFQKGNLLISNDGNNITKYYAEGDLSTSQRTAIGQSADGTVIMVVTDGRSASSLGATHDDIIDIMSMYGAVTAGMLDGGSSSLMYYKDYYLKYDYDINTLDKYQKMGLVNKYKAFTTPRYIPTAFVVKE